MATLNFPLLNAGSWNAAPSAALNFGGNVNIGASGGSYGSGPYSSGANPTGQVLGISTTTLNQPSTNSKPTVTNTSPSSAIGPGQNGYVNPNTQGSTQQAQVDPFQQAIDAAFGAEMGYLDQAQSTLQNAQGGIISGINQGIDTARQNIDASHQAGIGQIDQSQQQGEQRKQDALIAARRLYNELIQGGQQRFGGSSSAGEAYAALTGRELQRNNQSTEKDFSTFMGQVTTAKNNLQVQYENGIRSLEQSRQDALRQAERDYQDRLLSIQHDRAMAAESKAQSQLSALQQLRNNVYAINVAQAQNTASLNTAKQQAETELQNYAQSVIQSSQQVGSAQTAYNTNTTLNPNTQLAIGNTGGAQAFNPTGQISPTSEKDRFGNRLFA